MYIFRKTVHFILVLLIQLLKDDIKALSQINSSVIWFNGEVVKTKSFHVIWSLLCDVVLISEEACLKGVKLRKVYSWYLPLASTCMHTLSQHVQTYVYHTCTHTEQRPFDLQVELYTNQESIKLFAESVVSKTPR